MFSNTSMLVVDDQGNFTVSIGPTADAGGPYNTSVAGGVQLDGTVVQNAATDMIITWTSDKAGTFDNSNIEDPIFTAGILGNHILTLTLTSTNANVQSDTATFFAAPATADAGGPYNMSVPSNVQLDGTVVQNAAADLVITWTSNKSGSFNNANIEDPIFTPGVLGSHVLTMTLTASNAEPVVGSTTFFGVSATTDAGGPYSTDWQVPVQLDGTLVQNAALNPVITWTSNKNGYFNNDNIADPIFTPTVSGTHTLTMTVTANNDTAKSSAAGLSVADVASIVDVGGPYTIYRGWRDGTGYNLDASMTFGSQEFYWRKWLNEFGVDDWYFGLNYGAGDPMPGVISASSRTTLGTYALGLRAESVNGVDIVSDYTTVDILEVQSSLPIWSGSNTSLDGSTISSDQSNADAWKMVDGSLFDPAITVSQGNIIYITLSNSAFIQTKTLWMQTTTAQFLRCDVYIWQISSNSWVKVGQLFNTDTSGNGLSLIHFSNLINSKMYKLVLLNAPLPITIAQIGISEL